MKAGFLGGGKAAAAKRQQQAAAQAALQQKAGASTFDPDPSAPAQAPAAPLDPARWQANWQQCLALLRTDQDESRFVGLLMATKLLPQGGDDAIQQVVDAVGFTFLQRLLLPLAQQQQPQQQLSGEARQKQQVSCAVGLAILSAACRLPGIAGSSNMQQLLPQLMTAAAQGLPGDDASTANDEDAAARAAAVSDALECALVCASSSSDAARAAASSNGVAAAATALQRAVRLPAISNNTVVRNGQAMLSMRLLECILEALSPQEQQHLLSVVSSPGGATAGEMALVAAAQLLAEGADTAGASRPATGAAPDTAMLQLEALHTLLLLLSGGATPASDAPSADQGRWAVDVRSGLERLLRSRVGAVQKQSALQVAALLEERLGPGWLLPGIDDIMQQRQQQQKQQQQVVPGSFLSVLVEVLCVELPMLLSDAMNPDALIPDSRGRTVAQAAQPGDAAAEAAAGSGEGAEGEAHDQEGDNMVVDEQPGSSTGPAGQQQQQRQQPADSDRQGAASSSAGMDAAAGAAAGASQAAAAGAAIHRTARERAEEGLPACFSLLEAVIAVLGDDEEAAEAAAEAEGASWRLPVLDPAVRGRLAARLSDTAQVLLDFLAYMEEHGGPGVEQDALVSGAVRLLSGLLAQAPELHSEAVRKGLPFLLSVHSAGGSIASGAAYMMPALSMLVDPGKSAEAHQWALRIATSDVALGALVAHAERLAAAAVRSTSRAGVLEHEQQQQQQQQQQEEQQGVKVAEDEEVDAGSLQGMLSAVSDVLTRVLEAAATVHASAGPSEPAPGTSAATAQSAGADAASQRPDVMRAVLPLLCSLPAWAETLHSSLRAELQSASSSDAYLQALERHVRPQGLAYTAHLVAAALRAALLQPAAPAGAAVAAPLPANALEGQGVSVREVEAACDAVLWALEVGYHCERYLLQASEVESEDEFSEAAMLQADLREDAEDMLEPWERCLGAAVGVLEVSRPMQEAALRQAWVQSALREEGGRQEAAHSVNLRLFLSTLRAVGAP